ncbi:MAG: hypothetical protein AAF735_07895 [Myxococcota bacterium]
MTNNVTPDHVEVALDKTSGAAFELFAQVFMGQIVGTDFVPLGGIHDGGADGAIEAEGIFEGQRAGVFMQATRQEDHRSKIRQTVDRLREFGRSPTTLFYVTARTVLHIDVEEIELSEELGVNVKIRDRNYIAIHLNDSPSSRGAFWTHLGHLLSNLRKPGSAELVTSSKHLRSPAVFVFLQQEIERREGNRTLAESVVDSLIVFALEGTDPEKGILRDRKEILRLIHEDVPFADALMKKMLDERLAYLSAKTLGEGREINHHTQESAYCLPYETRQGVEEENIKDQALVPGHREDDRLGWFTEGQGGLRGRGEARCFVLGAAFAG